MVKGRLQDLLVQMTLYQQHIQREAKITNSTMTIYSIEIRRESSRKCSLFWFYPNCSFKLFDKLKRQALVLKQ